MSDNTYITKDELEKFKEELLAEMEKGFDQFVDDFLEAMDESKKSCSCGDTGDAVDPNESLENSARYIIFSGGQKYFATDIKPNAFAGIDFYFHEVDPKTSKEYNSQGTITSADVVIVDLQPEMSLETFSAIKKSTIDYVVSQAQEAKAKEDASKNTLTGNPPKDVNVNYMSSYT